MLRFLAFAEVMAVVLAVIPARAAEFFAAPGGAAGNAGTRESPWDIATALGGGKAIRPGDTVLLLGGTYRRRPQEQFEVRLAGSAEKPVHVRPAPGARATIDGGLAIVAPSAHVWVRGLEILVSENFTMPREIGEGGSHPESYGRPWGGLNVNGGTACKFIHLVIHHCAQAVSCWSAAHDTEIYGCLLYENGWKAPDRGHGHCIYTQNETGTKRIRRCIMQATFDGQYTVHAYGSSRAFVDDFLIEENICRTRGTFLVGGGRPSRSIRVLGNICHGVPMQIGYDAPYNEDCEVRDNTIVGADLLIRNYRRVIDEGNRIVPAGAARPERNEAVWFPSAYDERRAHLAVFNWRNSTTVEVPAAPFLARGERFRVLDPCNVFGPAIVEETCDGDAILVPVEGEFGAFVVVKDGAPRGETGRRADSEPPPAFPSPHLDCVTSWVGNTYPGNPAWVQQDIRALTVTPDGTVFTNVEWEEGGGNAGEYRAGELVRYARHTHGWGNLGGEAIAANPRHVFIGMQVHNEGGGLVDAGTWPAKGSKWFGVSRRLRSDIAEPAPFAGGKGGKGDTLKESFLVVAETAEGEKTALPGLCADATRLYVADPYASEIKVYDAESMQPAGRWSTERVGPLALSPSGELWMLRKGAASLPASFVRFDARGRELRPPLPLPGEVEAAAFCFAPDGRVLVADDGPSQQIRIYALDGSALRETGTFGEQGGIYAGTPGVPGDRKLNRVTAIGCDARGDLYVAHDGQTGGGGTLLESYGPDGRLNWRLHGLTFVDMADVDPAGDADVFTKEERFTLDYSRPAGKEWRYAGYTVNRFKYPQDPRLHIWSAGAWVRRIDGARFLFVTDMNARHLQVYRFAPRTDGEIAIPCGLFTGRRIRNDDGWPPHQPLRGAWNWRDADGDGAFGADEYEGEPTDAPAYQGWWVDSAGTLWVATETRGLRCFPVKAPNAHGVPSWPASGLKAFRHPAEFKEVKRLRYEPATDTLYLGGTTAEHRNQHWKPMGPVIARYDDWMRGNRAPRWVITAPYAVGSKGHESCEPMGFDAAGDFLFVPYTGASKAHGVKTGRVEVFRAADGAPVGHFEPDDRVGEIGLQDIRECLRAHRRADGEYLVFLEDDYKAKVVMFRWRPAAAR